MKNYVKKVLEASCCSWANSNPLCKEYHDKEWGVPIRDDNTLFELLILEGAQAGLSWHTILKKRDGYRKAFDGFNPKIITFYDEIKIKELLNNKDIVRNEKKIRSTINNATSFLLTQKNNISFSNYIWSFTAGKTIKNNFKSECEIPTTSALSLKISRDMKRKGFSYVGPKIIYSYLQAIGIINDHLVGCSRHNEINDLSMEFIK